MHSADQNMEAHNSPLVLLKWQSSEASNQTIFARDQNVKHNKIKWIDAKTFHVKNLS